MSAIQGRLRTKFNPDVDTTALIDWPIPYMLSGMIIEIDECLYAIHRWVQVKPGIFIVELRRKP